MKQTVTRNGVGAWTTRKYDLEKAAGTLAFTDDLRFGPELLHARAFRSTKAHAEILSVDVSEAMKVKGVVKVITGKDFIHRFGLYLMDRTPLAIGKVRYVGEPVALVIGETEEAARQNVLANEQERARMKSGYFREAIARGIAEGIQRYRRAG